MKKNIWIWNHYATDMYQNQGGRHYWFAENLIKRGYNPTIFCASTVHNSNKNIDTGDKKYTLKSVNEIPFVFIKTPSYTGNGKKRIFNMLAFYKNLFPVAKEYVKLYGVPDVILASSVHPLTLVAGIKIAKKFGVCCICEIRDLWPESLVAYGELSKNSLVARLFYQGEKWIYQKADSLIFTMEGGRDYIVEKGWDLANGGSIDINKVKHINNGIDLELFENNKMNFTIRDDDLEDENTFKVVYTGSIRLVNNVKKIVEIAHVILKLGYKNIKFLIYGEGAEKQYLESYCKESGIENVIFKGFLNKNYIPYVLSKCNLNIVHFDQNRIKKFGASLNKLFEYLASGKPIISDCEFGYDLIKKYNCGTVIDSEEPQKIAEAIIEFSKITKEEYREYCINAKKVAEEYDFKVLTDKLIKLL